MNRTPVVLAILSLYAFGLDHGVPTRDHALAVFGPAIPVVELVRLREQVYDEHGGPLGHITEPAPGQEIKGPLLLNLIRSHLLQPVTSDEQIMIGQLSRIRHQLPDCMQYGNLAPAFVGAALILAHFIGFLRLTPDVGYYLTNPIESGRIYIAGRISSAMAIVAAALL